uniref:uncharacterized protein n=1 Tax=Semicossyphus pulcher TaxID=241346 RepID=UPI0037E99762
MSVQFCLALLALSSLTAADDSGCNELIKPLQDRSRLSGQWIFVAGTSNDKEVLEELKISTSIWMELSLYPDRDDVNIHVAENVTEECIYGKVNLTFSGNSTMISHNNSSTDGPKHWKHLATCPDCALWTDDSVSPGRNKETRAKARILFLFTRSGTLDAAQLEVFKKQAACLNFLSEFHFGELKDLCPDKKAEEEPSSPTAQAHSED